ncbi:MAG: hypothetical protein RIQ90_1590, partial [Bacteroidota bacterium]
NENDEKQHHINRRSEGGNKPREIQGKQMFKKVTHAIQ